MLSAAGIGSGLDVESIVQQLMQVEQQPLLALQQKQQGLDADLSAFGQLKSGLSTFQSAVQKLSTASALKVFTATSENDSVFTATASSSAAPGSFGIEVTRLAERHKLASAEFPDTTTFGGNAGDALAIQVGEDVNDTLTVDLATAMSLAGIRDAINDDAANPGVAATIIAGNDGNEKLVLTAADSGAGNALTLSYSGSLTSATFGFQTVNDIGGDTSLLDAEIVVDGYTVTRDSNSIDDVIQGVTLDLHGASPGSSDTLTIDRDTEAVTQSVQGFVDAFNEIRDTLTSLGEGQLEADSTLLTIERRLINIINTPASGLSSGLGYLAEIGVAFLKDGTLSLNNDDLNGILLDDFDAVAELFSSDGEGFASRFDAQVESWLDTDGLLDIRTDGIADQQQLLEGRELDLQHRLELTEARYRAQFTQLDTLLGNLQATSDYLTQQLQTLPAVDSG